MRIGNSTDPDLTGSRIIPRLVKTELAILHLVAMEGMRNAKIAEVFGVTESAVKNKLRRVSNVLGTDSRLQVATFVHRSQSLRTAAADAYRELVKDRA